jgi:DNA-binding MarR family transcriptional regulator
MTRTARPSPGQLMHEFMIRLARGKHGRDLAIMHDSGVTLPQMIALHVCKAQPRCTVNFVAEQLNLPMSTTSVLVQRLVDKHWALRSENPDDRREKQLSLTKTGLSLINELERERAATLTSGLDVLPGALRDEFLTVVNKCLTVLREPNQHAMGTTKRRIKEPT